MTRPVPDPTNHGQPAQTELKSRRTRWFDRASIRELDRLATAEFGIPSIVLMENAGRAIAEVVNEKVRDSGIREIVVLCGGGNNGGDGFVAARHLHNTALESALGTTITLVLAVPFAVLQGDAGINARITRAMGLRAVTIDPASPLESLPNARGPLILVDALLGTGLDRPVGEPMSSLIGWTNARASEDGSEVVAVDLPSGLDCDSGEPLGVVVRASTTVTLVGPKVGFRNLAAHEYLGEVRVGDIGVPRELVDRLAQRTGA